MCVVLQPYMGVYSQMNLRQLSPITVCGSQGDILLPLPGAVICAPPQSCTLLCQSSMVVAPSSLLSLLEGDWRMWKRLTMYRKWRNYEHFVSCTNQLGIMLHWGIKACQSEKWNDYSNSPKRWLKAFLIMSVTLPVTHYSAVKLHTFSAKRCQWMEWHIKYFLKYECVMISLLQLSFHHQKVIFDFVLNIPQN